MVCELDGAKPVNSFALVSYIPDPLGGFLDRLRQELVPSCLLHSHVSILAPRPLNGHADEAFGRICSRMKQVNAFELHLGDVEIFENTAVVYIAIRDGFEELKAMHGLLNAGALSFEEPHSYHPHITLAQDFPREQLHELAARAARRWSEFDQKRAFPLEEAAFVQNTDRNIWINLGHCPLSRVPATL